MAGSLPFRRDAGKVARLRSPSESEEWCQTRLGWVRTQAGAPDAGGYPPPRFEVGLVERYVSLRGRDVLEVGCGDGRLTFDYAARARTVIALDANAAEIARARAEARRRGLGRVRFLVRPAQRAIPGGPFDVALFTWSL